MGLEGIQLVTPTEKSNHNYFKYIIIIEKFDRKNMHKVLENNGISPSGYVYELPLHKQPVLRDHNKIIFYLKLNYYVLAIFVCQFFTV